MSLSKIVVSAATVVAVMGHTATPGRFSKHTQLEGYTFGDYLRESGKRYEGDEYNHRLNVFKNNMKRIQQHNSENHSWKMGVNKFTDMTQEERSVYLGADKRALLL